MAILEQAQQRYPEAALGQEREALAIEALARLGRHAEARARAEAFLRLWPNSPYADTVAPHLQ